MRSVREERTMNRIDSAIMSDAEASREAAGAALRRLRRREALLLSSRAASIPAARA